MKRILLFIYLFFFSMNFSQELLKTESKFTVYSTRISLLINLILIVFVLKDLVLVGDIINYPLYFGVWGISILIGFKGFIALCNRVFAEE